MTSENTPARDPELDAKMLAELRDYRKATRATHPFYRVTDQELDLLLAIADERDALRETVEAEWPSVLTDDERDPRVTGAMVDAFGAAWEAKRIEIGDRPAPRGAKTRAGLMAALEARAEPIPEKISQPMESIPVDIVAPGTAYPQHETKREQWPCWICDEAITIRHGAKLGTARFRHVEMGEYAHDAVRGPDPIDRVCQDCGLDIKPIKAGLVGVDWVAEGDDDMPAFTCDHHPRPKLEAREPVEKKREERDYPSHAVMCGIGSAGSCFVPWCSCGCHAWARANDA